MEESLWTFFEFNKRKTPIGIDLIKNIILSVEYIWSDF